MTTPATLAALAAAIDAQYLNLSIEALGVGTTPERRRELQFEAGEANENAVVEGAADVAEEADRPAAQASSRRPSMGT